MSDDEEEVEEDPRIAKLYSFAEKHCDEDGKYKGDGSDFVELLDKVGTADAIVLGGMWAGPALYCRAHFAVAALIDTDEMTISASRCPFLKLCRLQRC